jgi:hypothetical protein
MPSFIPPASVGQMFNIPPEHQPIKPQTVKPQPVATKAAPPPKNTVKTYLYADPQTVKAALARNPMLAEFFDPATQAIRPSAIPPWAKQLKQQLGGASVQTVVLYDRHRPQILFLYGSGPKQGQPINKPNGQPVSLPFVPPKTPVVSQGDHFFDGQEGAVDVLPTWNWEQSPQPPGSPTNPLGIGAVRMAYVQNLTLNNGQPIKEGAITLHNWYPTPQGQQQVNQWLQQAGTPQSNGCFRANATDVLAAMLLLGNTAQETSPDSTRLVDGYDAITAKAKPGSRHTQDVVLLQADMSHYTQGVQVRPAASTGKAWLNPRSTTRQLATELPQAKQAIAQQLGLPVTAIMFDDGALKQAIQNKTPYADVGDLKINTP